MIFPRRFRVMGATRMFFTKKISTTRPTTSQEVLLPPPRMKKKEISPLAIEGMEAFRDEGGNLGPVRARRKMPWALFCFNSYL
mmetsp:Transcript_52295/g.103870  ORF Transcript_52295/g.103870 Transcript_52295/m.103870 type:complete len:83 (+) Transcript_52295:688-936(+)